MKIEKNIKKKALYFCITRSTFIENDLQIISLNFDVKVFLFNPKAKWMTPFRYCSQFFFIITQLFSCNIMICFFGGHHSLLPSALGKLFNKPCVIVLGGTDCVSFPSIGYGNFQKKILGKITRWSYRLAAMLIPVHKSLVEYDYTYEDHDFKKQGFLYFCPGLKTPYTVIHNGYDPEKWKNTSIKIPNSFITVAAGLQNPYRVKLKGVDLIIEAARYFPDARFTIIGWPDANIPDKPSNITVHSFVPNNQLKDFYSSHQFYIQISMSEGFPNTLCEAMLSGCIPIGSNVGGIPDIIDDTGFILYKRDVEKLKELLKQAMNCDKPALSDKARQRIISNFHNDLRKKQLLSLLLKLAA